MRAAPSLLCSYLSHLSSTMRYGTCTSFISHLPLRFHRCCARTVLYLHVYNCREMSPRLLLNSKRPWNGERNLASRQLSKVVVAILRTKWRPLLKKKMPPPNSMCEATIKRDGLSCICVPHTRIQMMLWIIWDTWLGIWKRRLRVPPNRVDGAKSALSLIMLDFHCDMLHLYPPVDIRWIFFKSIIPNECTRRTFAIRHSSFGKSRKARPYYSSRMDGSLDGWVAYYGLSCCSRWMIRRRSCFLATTHSFSFLSISLY